MDLTRNRSVSPPKNRLRLNLDILPFKSANPEQLQEITQMSDSSPEPHLGNYGYKFSTLPAGMSSVSPLRARTMKEYDQQITDLKKENFNLKLRIYFLEDKMNQKYGASSDDHLQVYKTNLELKVETESLKKDLNDKHELLSQASGALEALERQHKASFEALQEKTMKQKHELEEQIEKLTKKVQSTSQDELSAQISTEIFGSEPSPHNQNETISKLNNEMKSLKEQSYKRDKAIQGLAEAVKVKQMENYKLQKRLKEQEAKNVNMSRSSDNQDQPNCSPCEHESRIKEITISLKNVQEEVERSAEAHRKICLEKDARIEHLQKSISDLETVLETKIDDTEYKEAVNKYENKILNLENVIEDKTMQLEELKCEKKLSEEEKLDRINDLEREMEALHKELNNEIDNCKYYQETCSEKEKDLKSVNIIMTAKQQELSHLNENFNEITKKLSLMQQEHEQSKNMYRVNEESYKEKISFLNKSVDKIKEELSSVKNNLAKTKDESDLFNKLLKEKDKTLNENESKKLALNYKLSMLNEQIQQLELENQKLKESNKVSNVESEECISQELLRANKELSESKSVNKNLQEQLISALTRNEMSTKSHLSKDNSLLITNNKNCDLINLKSETDGKDNHTVEKISSKQSTDYELHFSPKKLAVAEIKVQQISEKLAISEDTIYSQNRKLDCYHKLLVDAGIDLTVINDSVDGTARLIGTPPEKLPSISQVHARNNFQSYSSSYEHNVPKKIQDNCDLDQSKYNSSLNVIYNENGISCKEHKAEIRDLRSRLSQSLYWCEMLECRLEEIADFLERLLHYDKYNGQLTPQQITSLKHYLSESRDLSHSLSTTLLGNPTTSIDCSAFRSALLSYDDSPSYLSPNNRDGEDKGSSGHMRSGNDSESIEKIRHAESSSQNDNVIAASVDRSLRLRQRQSSFWSSNDVGVFKKPHIKLGHSLDNENRTSMNNQPSFCETKQVQAVNADSASDSDVWSEPDRNVSFQRIGLDSSFLQPSMQQYAQENHFSTSDTNTTTEIPQQLTITSQALNKSQNEVIIQQLESKLQNMQQLNNSLKAELDIYRNLGHEKQSKLDEQFMPGFMSKHLAAIRALHGKLEQSIKTNEFLQHALEEQLNKEHGNQKFIEDSNFKDELEKCREKITEQEHNYKQVCFVNNELQEKFIQKCQEVDSEKSSLIQVQQKISNYENRISSLQLANENFQKHTEKLNEQLGDVENLSKLNAELRKKLKNVEVKLCEFKNNIDEKDKEMKQVQDWNLRLQTEITSKENSSKHLELESQKYREEIVKKDERILKVKAELQEFQNILKTKDEKIKKLQNGSEDIKKQLIDLQKFKNDKQSVENVGDQILEKIKTDLKIESLENKKLKAENKDLRSKLLKFYSDLYSMQSNQDLDDQFNIQVAHKPDSVRGSCSREVSTESSMSFTMLPSASDRLSKEFSTATLRKDCHSLTKDELSSRVANFLSSDHYLDSRYSENFLQSSNVKRRESSNRSVRNAKNDESSSGEGKLQRRSVHYSSPDLGIESDPNNRDGKDSVYSTMDEEGPSARMKHNGNSTKQHKVIDVKTNELRDIILENGDQDGHLYVMSPLMQHELLKKEVTESLVILGGLHSRIKNRLEKSSGRATSHELESNMLVILDANCKSIEMCLQKSSHLLLSFSIFDISTLRHNLQESSEELMKKNYLLEEELKNIKLAHEKQQQEASNKLSIAQKKKKGMEKAIAKQLQKTNMVLRQAKTNLQNQES